MTDQSAMPETMPHSIEAEQMLLGCIMAENKTWPIVGGILTTDDFYEPTHGRIWSVLKSRISRNHLADATTLWAAMGDDAGLKELGGLTYLARMVGISVAPRYAKDYADIIRDKSARRHVKRSVESAKSALDGVDPVEVTVARLQADLMGVPQASGQESSVSILSATTRMIERQNLAYQGEEILLKTGLDPLDRIIGGLDAGDLMLLGGSTSMGKTAVAGEISHRIATRGLGVAYVSLEMEDVQIATRITSTLSGVPYAAMRDAGQVEEKDFRKWVDRAKRVATLPIQIIPKNIRDVAAVHAAAERAKVELGDGTPLSLLVVDYAQLLRAEGKGRYEQMTNVSIGLKTIAGMLKIPVIALVQLDRKMGERDDRRPNLSDIKETGQFENDADVVVFCHREQYYLERQGPKVGKDGRISEDARADWEADMAAHKNRIELIVRKMRQGQLGVAEMGFHAPTNRFWNLGDSQQTDFE